MPAATGLMEGTAPYGRSNGRRSASGASTHSQDSAMTHDFQYQHQARYAPIRPMSQPIGQPQEGFPVAVQSFETDHSALQHIQHYNTSQDPIPHPQVMAFQHNQQFAPYDPSLHSNTFHAMSEGLPESRPASRQRGPSVGSVSIPPGEPDARTKKQASANAANERELRELIEKNSDRTLESIAKDVRGAERTQKAERAKQLFAMRWLKQFCKIDKESVPRNRVYTHYTQRCGSERVDTLNPASFGKLVRVIFPGIQTRRLGVRGESKYHYVNLSLAEDPAARGITSARPASASNAPGMQTREGSIAPVEQEEAGQTNGNHAVNNNRPPTAPSQSVREYTMQQNEPPNFNAPMTDAPSNPSSFGQLFADPTSRGFEHESTGPQMYEQQLRFSNSTAPTVSDGALAIPRITTFLPPRADEDLAENIEALYRTHCTSLIDSVRYVREKQFFKLLTGFNGQMTVPVAKLFSAPSMAPWIKQCDLIMYRQIVRFVSQLCLQVIPPQVHSMLNRISDELPSTTRLNFRNFPPHVLQAKLEPCTIFCSLLKRLIRVNETAHAAANLLMNDPMRNLMWQDWVRCVKPKRVIETEIPNTGREDTYTMLTSDVHRLLEPLQPVDWTNVEVGTDFVEEVFRSYSRAEQGSAEGIIEKWAAFLKSVPSKFSSCPTRTLLHCMNAVSTAALRDITVGQAQSFGGWWITKVWVDEMMLWMAESGGFLDPESRVSSSRTEAESFESTHEIAKEGNHRLSAPSRSQSTLGGLGINFQTMPTFEPTSVPDRPATGPPTASFRLPPKQIHKHDHFGFDMNGHHDEDSGIGMSLLDDSEHHGYLSGHQGHHDEFAALLS